MNEVVRDTAMLTAAGAGAHVGALRKLARVP
jgi:hypothetical protein